MKKTDRFLDFFLKNYIIATVKNFVVLQRINVIDKLI
jgi:hypothetical protein